MEWVAAVFAGTMFAMAFAGAGLMWLYAGPLWGLLPLLVLAYVLLRLGRQRLKRSKPLDALVLNSFQRPLGPQRANSKHKPKTSQTGRGQ